eukprot:TRINITY_DN7837_c0_g1_i1.p1 TRINITY_DN7837_c0_g1~~TRINITY_DN7837_c0_g1_i1.p1  ORF type:complete len:797 (-),score=191.71 TRINITY_DN7837_c0_g1_i1:183-2501(-)
MQQAAAGPEELNEEGTATGDGGGGGGGGGGYKAAQAVKKASDASSRRPEERRSHSNARFDAFYKENLMPAAIKDDKEWDVFMKHLNLPLPCTLWIASTSSNAEEVREFLRRCQKTAESLTSNGCAGGSDAGSELKVQPLKWWEDEMAWCVDVPKAVLRKDPMFKPLHQFLIKHTAEGAITRMEEVSMLPVALLDIGAGSRCLDMCAAPGSKTAQMLAALAAANFRQKGRGLQTLCSEEVRQCRTFLRGRVDYSTSDGFVLANDNDTDRLGMLVHQVQRLRELYPLALFSYHDARYFPSVRRSDGTPLRFDRILCDVMCSSDGTLRKEPHMWRRWNVRDSLELHSDQLAIALRAARLLDVGGQMVYSTCSMSPIENEAVVAEILRRTKGCLKLANGRTRIAPFLAADGLQSWKVAHPATSKLYCSYEDAVAADGPHKLLKKGNFPPSRTSEIASVLPHCVRVLPHHNDTGGFFVALFEKTAELPEQAAPGADSAEDGIGYNSDQDDDGEEVKRKEQLERLQREAATGKSEQERLKAEARLERAKKSGVLMRELVRYLPITTALPDGADALMSMYGFSHDYGDGISFPLQQFFCRYHLELEESGNLAQVHKGDANQLVFCAAGVAEVLAAGVGDHAKRKLKVMGGGIRAFRRDGFGHIEGSHYRPAQEAVELLMPYYRSRLVVLDELADTKRLLCCKAKNAPLAELTAVSKERLSPLVPGGCVLLLKTAKGDHFAVAALRTVNAINVYVDDNEIVVVREACGVAGDYQDDAGSK